MIELIIGLCSGAIAGLAGGWLLIAKSAFGSRRITQQRSQAILQKAEQEATTIVAEAKKLADERRQELSELKEAIAKTKSEESHRLSEIETTNRQLAERSVKLDSRSLELDKRQDSLRKQEEEILQLRQILTEHQQKQVQQLEKIAKLSQEEAAEKLTKMVENNIKGDLAGLIAKAQAEAKATGEQQARSILVATMERLASEVVADRTVVAVKLDNEKIKGRIIGKDGRNISSFQRITGVDVLTDDSPNVIVLSCFDPIRREVARQAMEMLIDDGRIHPGRIESLVEKAREQVQKEVTLAAEEAAREVGIIGIPPEIMQLLGELKFRTSFGQNVLKHSIEMAHLAGVLASQIGADVNICKYAALVHDLGKALTHKMEGKHHHLSGEMLRKYGVSEAVSHAAEAHHDDIEATTVEAMVIRAVDAISAARPGARNSNTDNFIKRMKELENIAVGFDGVEKAYAINAGREIWVFAHPKDLDDLQSIQLSRDVATKIESMMSYAGTIKVVVIRETRAVEFAK